MTRRKNTNFFTFRLFRKKQKHPIETPKGGREVPPKSVRARPTQVSYTPQPPATRRGSNTLSIREKGLKTWFKGFLGVFLTPNPILFQIYLKGSRGGTDRRAGARLQRLSRKVHTESRQASDRLAAAIVGFSVPEPVFLVVCNNNYSLETAIRLEAA